MGNVCAVGDYIVAGQQEEQVYDVTADDLKDAFLLGMAYSARAIVYVLTTAITDVETQTVDFSMLLTQLGGKTIATTRPWDGEAITVQSVTQFLSENQNALSEGRLVDNSRQSALPIIATADETAAKDSCKKWTATFNEVALGTFKIIAEEHKNGSSMSSLKGAALACGEVSSGTINVDFDNLSIPSLYSIVAAALKTDMAKTGVSFSNMGFVQALNVQPDNLQASLVLSGMATMAHVSGDQSTSGTGDAMSLSAARTGLRKSVRNSLRGNAGGGR